MKIKDINISFNPIIIPLIEICEQGISQMRLYYEAEHESKRPIAGVSFEEKYLQGSRTIGEGVFSTVFAGTDRASGRKVTIKVIDCSKMQWGDHDALQDEIENLQTLQGGPHIVELYDVYMPNSEECFLVMECLKGGELFDRILEKKTFLEDKARQVTRGLLEAASAVYAFPKN
jgi:predicted Ser/Thr protein kinase